MRKFFQHLYKTLLDFFKKLWAKLSTFGKNLWKFFKDLPSNLSKGFKAFKKHPKQSTIGFFKLSYKLLKRHSPEALALILLFIFIFPFYIVFINTSKPNILITDTPLSLPDSWNTMFMNMQTIFQDSRMRYFPSLFNSFIITSLSLILIGVSSGMAAWVLVRTKTRLSMTIFLFIISGLVIPFQVVMLPLVTLLDTLRQLTGIPWKDTHHAVIIAYMGFGAPLSVFLFHGFIKSIPIDIEEAAIIDGCSRPQVFFKIILPILKPIFVTLLVLNGMWIWNDFLLPLLIIGRGGTTQTLPLAVANLAGAYVRQWNLLLTALVLSAIPIIVLFMFAQKHIIKGMTSGAVK